MYYQMWWLRMRNFKLLQIRPLISSLLHTQRSPIQTTQIFPPLDNYFSNPNSTVISTALQNYINSGSPFQGLKIHTHILKIGYQPNSNICIKLLILYLKCGSLCYARQLFDEMPQRTLSSYNYMLDGYVKNGEFGEAFDLVRRMMLSCDEKPDGFTLSLILKAWASGFSDLLPMRPQAGGKIRKVEVIGQEVVGSNLINPTYVPKQEGFSDFSGMRSWSGGKTVEVEALGQEVVGSNLTDLTYIPKQNELSDFSELRPWSNGKMTNVEAVGQELIGVNLTGSTYLLKQKGVSDFLGVSDVARQVHAWIVKLDIRDDVILMATLLDSYVKCGRIGCARQVLDAMLVDNVFCSTAMISGYMNGGRIKDAEEIFMKMNEKDVVIFNAMIEGYSRSVETAKKSIETYIDMKRLNFDPTVSTFASLIGACSLLTLYETGQQVQIHMIKTRYDKDIKTGSALIDMYSKCGKMEDARRVFNHMPERNIFSWTSLIDGYGRNGNSHEALEMFDKMQRDHRTKPNDITFLSVLAACSHAGLVEKGQEIFKSMERYYAMKPKMEHYACMVDLLGRSGRIKEAWEFVKRMPKKPNSDVWAALLSSCKIHGEVEMAKRAAEELFKECVNARPGAYVGLSNTLAAVGRWDGVNEVRGLMKMRGVAKDTGFSRVGDDD